MKQLLYALPLMFLFLTYSASAADKPEEKKEDAKPAGTPGSWSGQLAASSGAGMAVLKVKEDKRDLVLWPESDAVKNDIEKLLKKRALASVSGTLAPDKTNVKVSSITEEERKKKGK